MESFDEISTATVGWATACWGTRRIELVYFILNFYTCVVDTI
jgi:hypothetical protein